MDLDSIVRPEGTAPRFTATPAPTAPSRTEPGGSSEGRVEDDRAAGPGEPESREAIERVVDEANSHLQALNESLDFRVHDETGQLLVQIVNRSTGEVVRESPPREFLDLAARMKEMVGLFLDEQG